MNPVLMEIRERIRSNTRVGAIAGGAALLVTLIVIWLEVTGGQRSVPVGEAFYTVDEGATLFADSADRIPPFDHDGKEAVLAAVFSCDQGKHQWVQYLLKYSQEGLDAVAEMKAGGAKNVHVPRESGLVKRPGDKNWMPVTDCKSIMTPRCPEGQAGSPAEVRP